MTRKDGKSGTKPKRNRKPLKPEQDNQATVDDFQREGMGVAPKE